MSLDSALSYWRLIPERVFEISSVTTNNSKIFKTAVGRFSYKYMPLLLKPFSFYVKCFTLSDLFAGKMHALLFRKWKGRVKGRDWFDMEWYIRKKIPLNLEHLLIRSLDSGDWKEKSITKEQLMAILQNKIQTVSYKKIREDVIRFIPDDKVIEIWSPQYFSDLAQKIKFA